MQKPLHFIVWFIASYLLFNLLYQAALFAYTPFTDPFTRFITRAALCFFPGIEAREMLTEPGITLMSNGRPVINIKEGCNALAVWISYISFTIAFRSALRYYLLFIPLSFIFIELVNVARLCLLIMLKMKAANLFQFFHAYAFPAIIYGFTFLMMVVWTKKARALPVTQQA